MSGNLYDPDISIDILAAITESQKEALIGKLLGGQDDPDTGSNEGETKEKADTATSLLNSVFGSKKDKKKKKKDDGGGND